MAPFADRVQMCRILTQPYKWLKVTDIEERCGTQRTFDTLSILTDMNPDTNFAWIMGADNLAGFHKWYKWQEIANLMPIAVLARPGETDKARMSQAGIEMTQIHAPADLIHAQSGYSILDNPMVDISSTQLRQNSERRITGTSPDVIKHIQSHQLYGF